MEPAQVPVTRYTIYTYIEDIFSSNGLYYVHLQGSHESVALGTEPLSFRPGDRVKITLEKVTTHAEPSQAPIQ